MHVALLRFPVLLQPKPIVQAAAPKGMVDLEATEVINKGKLQVAVAVFPGVSLAKYQRKHLDRREILARCQQSKNDILHDALFGSEIFDEKAMTIVACSAVSSMHHVKTLIVIQRREIDRLRSLAESRRQEAQHAHARLHESKECSSMLTVLASVVTSFASKSQSLVRIQRRDLETSRLENNTLQQKNTGMQQQIAASTAEVERIQRELGDLRHELMMRNLLVESISKQLISTTTCAFGNSMRIQRELNDIRHQFLQQKMLAGSLGKQLVNATTWAFRNSRRIQRDLIEARRGREQQKKEADYQWRVGRSQRRELDELHQQNAKQEEEAERLRGVVTRQEDNLEEFRRGRAQQDVLVAALRSQLVSTTAWAFGNSRRIQREVQQQQAITMHVVGEGVKEYLNFTKEREENVLLEQLVVSLRGELEKANVWTSMMQGDLHVLESKVRRLVMNGLALIATQEQKLGNMERQHSIQIAELEAKAETTNDNINVLQANLEAKRAHSELLEVDLRQERYKSGQMSRLSCVLVFCCVWARAELNSSQATSTKLVVEKNVLQQKAQQNFQQIRRFQKAIQVMAMVLNSTSTLLDQAQTHYDKIDRLVKTVMQPRILRMEEQIYSYYDALQEMTERTTFIMEHICAELPNLTRARLEEIYDEAER